MYPKSLGIPSLEILTLLFPSVLSWSLPNPNKLLALEDLFFGRPILSLLRLVPSEILPNPGRLILSLHVEAINAALSSKQVVLVMAGKPVFGKPLSSGGLGPYPLRKHSEFCPGEGLSLSRIAHCGHLEVFLPTVYKKAEQVICWAIWEGAELKLQFQIHSNMYLLIDHYLPSRPLFCCNLWALIHQRYRDK